MKRCLFYLITVALVTSGNLLHASGTTEPVDTVIRFYEASQDGDTETMKQLIAGSFYNTRKVLLEENQEYPNFLREYYQGTKVEIINSVVNGANASVDVKIEFPNGGVDNIKLLLKKDDSTGIWKIVDETHS